jgi:hypothetical protein
VATPCYAHRRAKLLARIWQRHRDLVGRAQPLVQLDQRDQLAERLRDVPQVDLVNQPTASEYCDVLTPTVLRKKGTENWKLRTVTRLVLFVAGGGAVRYKPRA